MEILNNIDFTKYVKGTRYFTHTQITQPLWTACHLLSKKKNMIIYLSFYIEGWI